MRNLFKTVVVLSLIAVTSLFSCSKKSEPNLNNAVESKADYSALLQKLNAINDKYATSNGKGNHTLGTFKDWCRAGAADVGGAWSGAWLGGKIGALFLNPTAGAVVGAVIVGAAASYGAYSAHSPSGDFFKENDPSTMAAYYNPNSNPFDSCVGRQHNIMMKDLYTTHSNGACNVDNIYSSQMLTADENTFWNKEKNFTYSSYTSGTENLSIEDFKSYVSNNIDDPNMVQIMNSFFDGMKNIETLTDVLSLVSDYEFAIMNEMSVSTENKNVLLEGLSVARYSFNMWNSAYKD